MGAGRARPRRRLGRGSCRVTTTTSRCACGVCGARRRRTGEERRPRTASSPRRGGRAPRQGCSSRTPLPSFAAAEAKTARSGRRRAPRLEVRGRPCRGSGRKKTPPPSRRRPDLRTTTRSGTSLLGGREGGDTRSASAARARCLTRPSGRGQRRRGLVRSGRGSGSRRTRWRGTDLKESTGTRQRWRRSGAIQGLGTTLTTNASSKRAHPSIPSASVAPIRTSKPLKRFQGQGRTSMRSTRVRRRRSR
mmetsp:Transcript_13399/g.44137  ORF Transcript_13399/g.44137 Transcript_13399/m.44137 type:complete len:248 (-) Transcript_13399:1543-2286(-)